MAKTAEERRAYQRDYYHKNAEARRAYHRRWTERNRPARKISKAGESPYGDTRTAEGLKAYRKAYYEAHKYKAAEHQKRRDAQKKAAGTPRWKRRLREQSRQAGQSYTASDLVHMPTEKAAQAFDKILRGEGVLVRSAETGDHPVALRAIDYSRESRFSRDKVGGKLA